MPEVLCYEEERDFLKNHYGRKMSCFSGGVDDGGITVVRFFQPARFIILHGCMTS